MPQLRRTVDLGSVGEWLLYIGIDPRLDEWEPFWPPDVFAVAAAYLRRTGGYALLVNGALTRDRLDALRIEAIAVGERWRDGLSSAFRARRLKDKAPPEITNWFDKFKQSGRYSFAEAAIDDEAQITAIRLCIASDVASAGIGVTPSANAYVAAAQQYLARNKNRSFCRLIDVEKLAVLGKQHTPQRGCTIRSLSHHLALYVTHEIQAYWNGPFQPVRGDLDVVNLLLLPWPTEVRASDFQIMEGPVARDAAFRYFEYSPATTPQPREVGRRIASAIERAREHADHIHGVVLPEAALTMAQFRAAEMAATRAGAMLIAGVRITGTANSLPHNVCAIQPLGLTKAARQASATELAVTLDATRRLQPKHHRWCLDRSQVLQYTLGGRVPASRDCWERIHVGNRSINFVTLTSWLTTCALICEDLARQEPVAEVLRAVGPNLVIALLMDGPQLRYRWPSRYASVLAEDPGCSVLSLTSLGMSRRSKPRQEEAAVPDKSNVIALWRDAIYGEREIELAAGHDACVLSLVCKSTREYTLDDRADAEQSHFPVFAGSYSFDSKTSESVQPASGGR